MQDNMRIFVPQGHIYLIVLPASASSFTKQIGWVEKTRRNIPFYLNETRILIRP